MCNLVTLNCSTDEVASHFKARRPKPTNASTGEVWKGGTGFVVRESGGQRMIETMTWGFPKRLKTMKPTSKPLKVNNARDDHLRNPYGMWREWFVQPGKRCLIPISAFAEAVGESPNMTRAWISVADQPIAACAGFWRPTDEWGDSYTMVMVDAVPEMIEIHDRMPVILHAAEWDRWLHAEADEAMELVTQYPADRLVVQHTNERWSMGSSKPKPTEGPRLI
ncbi:SOS response-associated peptidase [Sphingopyxis sp.]|jgi:putative SOS response-associated peptidase YedK|uniref:SOS response-associated peptidase n=1 Tax=Sphingopyxis sp. TaxID=1908224 RepID=UPI002DE859FF|nr:SOS response-associated peptidase family protein [Sphingopyxis sp.]